MSGTPDHTPILAVNCPNCGRQNAAGRQFCQFCGHRLAPRQKDEPASKGPPNTSAEVQELQASLQAAQDENRDLREQLAAMQEQLNKAKAVSAKPELPSVDLPQLQTELKSEDDRAATVEPQSPGWEKKSQSAEEKTALFEKQMAAQALDAYKNAADLAQHYAQTEQPATQKKLAREELGPQATTIQHDYKYADAAKDPFNVTAMYHDDRFTYIEATPHETLAVYELKDGKPVLIQHNLDRKMGRYTIPKVLEDGYLLVGKSELRFHREAKS